MILMVVVVLVLIWLLVGIGCGLPGRFPYSCKLTLQDGIGAEFDRIGSNRSFYSNSLIPEPYLLSFSIQQTPPSPAH